MSTKRKPRPTLAQLHERGWYISCHHDHFNQIVWSPESATGKTTLLKACTTVALYPPGVTTDPESEEGAFIGKAWCAYGDQFERKKGVRIAVERALKLYWSVTGIDVRQ